MELAPAGVELTFEVTYDSPGLDVGMSVWDTSGDDPVLVQGPAAMNLVAGNTYYGKFTGAQGKSYVVIKAVYTDDTFDTVDDSYAQGSESIVVEDVGGGGSSGGQVVGYVENQGAVVGFVDC